MTNIILVIICSFLLSSVFSLSTKSMPIMCDPCIPLGDAGGQPKNGCARVYVDCEYEGQYLDVCADIPDLSVVDFGDTISSVKLSSNAKVQLFKNTNFEGDKLDVDWNNSCLNVEATVLFNDHVNSIKLLDNQNQLSGQGKFLGNRYEIN